MVMHDLLPQLELGERSTWPQHAMHCAKDVASCSVSGPTYSFASCQPITHHTLPNISKLTPTPEWTRPYNCISAPLFGKELA